MTNRQQQQQQQQQQHESRFFLQEGNGRLCPRAQQPLPALVTGVVIVGLALVNKNKLN